MSSGGYDAPHMSSNLPRYEPRRTSGPIPGMYDRPAGAIQRRTPSPAGSRRAYDSYVPARSAVTFRDEHPNVYRPNIYRPDYTSSSFYSRSPSPDRYAGPPRSAESDHWDRQNPWQATQGKLSGWQDRKPPPPSPTTSVRSRGNREEVAATRMFEPSDNWKQSHVDRREEGTSSNLDRYEYPSRVVQDTSPDGSSRPGRRASFLSGGDRYRPPPPKRDSHPNIRLDYDSYRPSYDKRDSRDSHLQDSSPPNHYRRGSLSTGSSRTWDHYEPPYNDDRTSLYRSRSPDWNPSPSPLHADTLNGARPYDDFDSRTGRKEISRRSSRSSIASTQLSDTQQVSCPPGTSKPPESPISNAKSPVSMPKIAPSVSLPAVPDSLPSASLAGGVSDQGKPTNSAFSPPALSPSLGKPASATVNTLTSLGRPGLSDANSHASVSDQSSQPTPTSAISPTSIVKAQLNGVAGTLCSKAPTPPSGDLASSPQIHPVPESTAPSSESLKKVSQATSSVILNAKSQDSIPLMSLSKGTDSATIKERFTPPLKPKNDAPPVAPTPSSSMAPTPIEPTTEAPTPTPSQLLSPSKGTPLDITNADQTNELQAINHVAESTIYPQDDIHGTKGVLLEFQSPFLPDAFTPSGTPSLAATNTMAEALRVVVMNRLVCDRRTNDAIVDPVLMANRALIQSTSVSKLTSDSTPEKLIEEVLGGPGAEKHLRVFEMIRPSLVDHFEQRQNLINDKIQRLSKEYLSLQEKWKVHCASLNEQQRSTLVSEMDHIHHAGRTTRRTAAFTDAVRSDLEMEQVIASLGNDDATDPNYLSARNAATIPDMISVTKGKIDFVFDDTNHRVDNPSEYYAPHTGIDDWTEEEKRIFIDKFAAFPKQFGIISEFLPHKSSTQCVDYYYLHKKRHIDFRKVVSQLAPNKRRRRGGGKKKGNALLTDIAQHDAEVGKDRLSTFVIPSRTAKGRRGGTRNAAKAHSSTPAGNAASTPQPEPKTVEAKQPADLRKLTVQFENTPTATPTPEPDGNGRPRRRKSGVNTPISTLGSAPILPIASQGAKEEEGETPPEPEPRPVKRAKRSRKQVKSAAIIDDEPASPPPEPTSAPLLSTPISIAALGFASSRERGSIISKKLETASLITSIPVATVQTGQLWSEEDKTSAHSLIFDFLRYPNPPVPSHATWSTSEKGAFMRLSVLYGQDLKRIAANMPHKTMEQVTDFFETSVRVTHFFLPPKPSTGTGTEPTPTPRSPLQPPNVVNQSLVHPSPPMASLTYDRSSKLVPAPHPNARAPNQCTSTMPPPMVITASTTPRTEIPTYMLPTPYPHLQHAHHCDSEMCPGDFAGPSAHGCDGYGVRIPYSDPGYWHPTMVEPLPYKPPTAAWHAAPGARSMIGPGCPPLEDSSYRPASPISSVRVGDPSSAIASVGSGASAFTQAGPGTFYPPYISSYAGGYAGGGRGSSQTYANSSPGYLIPSSSSHLAPTTYDGQAVPPPMSVPVLVNGRTSSTSNGVANGTWPAARPIRPSPQLIGPGISPYYP